VRRALLIPVATAIGVAAFGVAAVALTARFVPITNRIVLAIVALAPYLMLGAPLSLVVFGLARHWIFAAAAAALTVATATALLPRFVRNHAAAGVNIRFVSANLRYGRADPHAVVKLAREHADILAVQELTPEKADLLSAEGLDQTFPHKALRAREGPAGVGIWSRYPIEQSDVDERFWLGMLTARVRISGLTSPAVAVATHMSAPWPEPIAGWRADLNRLSTTLRQIAAEANDTPILVGGDLNATADMREFRQLLRDGYHDAAEQAGAGVTRTHPADIVVPPVFAVDHILTRGCTATSARTLQVPGSDHRALAADIVVQQ
jgi:endonuclease/exonuclease/phosphatase (EEP) superfamily protein YafD